MPIVFALLFSFLSSAAAPLPELKTHAPTVSGVSSGAFLAVQLQVALAEKIEGAGIVAGGIYGCAEGKATRTIECMQAPEKINTESHIKAARAAAEAGLNDPVSALARARLHIFHSEADKTVKFAAAAKLKEFFLAFIPAENIEEQYSQTAAHGFPTLSHGNDCEKGGLPWLQNCGVDGAGNLLKQLYPGLSEPQESPIGDLLSYDQSVYADPEAGLLVEGKVYVPQACAAGETCRLHVALHGCRMSTDFAANEFVEHAGYNRWAAANRIVVLYPQAAKSAKNPNGCWDWFGYTGQDYAVRSGKQIQAIRRMIEAISI